MKSRYFISDEYEDLQVVKDHNTSELYLEGSRKLNDTVERVKILHFQPAYPDGGAEIEVILEDNVVIF